VTVADSDTEEEFGTLHESGYINVPKTTDTVDLYAEGADGKQFEKFEIDNNGNTTTSCAVPTTVDLKNDITVTAYFIDQSDYENGYYRVNVDIEPDRAGSLTITGDDGVVYGKLYKDGYINVAKSVVKVTLKAESVRPGYQFDRYEIADPTIIYDNPVEFDIADFMSGYAADEPLNMVVYFVPMEKNYYITATSDNGSTISPSGVTVVGRGENQTFYFSAKDGYHITSVTIDNVPISQADIDKGYYTFRNVLMNHFIDVKSSPGDSGGQRTDLTLRIDVAEGRGYAEYSIDGSPFVTYTEVVNIPEHADVIVRAYADDGYEFVKWETPNVETSSEVPFEDVGGSLHLYLYFSGESSPAPSSDHNGWLWWILALIILLILVALLLWFLLFYRRYYDVVKVSSQGVTIIGDDRVHRKSKYVFKIEGVFIGKVSYRIGEDGQWKLLIPASDEYTIPKGEITDTVTIEVR
jgi:hypothetical protein